MAKFPRDTCLAAVGIYFTAFLFKSRPWRLAVRPSTLRRKTSDPACAGAKRTSILKREASLAARGNATLQLIFLSQKNVMRLAVVKHANCRNVTGHCAVPHTLNILLPRLLY